MLKLKAAFFDLDGTLLDTLQDLAGSMNETLSLLGFPGHPVEAYRYFVGDGMEILAQRSLPENDRNAQTLEKAVAVMKQVYEARCAETTRPYPGISEALKTLSGRNIPLAVITNKPHEFALKTLRHYFSDLDFYAIRGVNPSQPKKPDPRCALEVAQSLNLCAQEIFYLGDTAVDMQTACTAGFFPAGALWGFRPRSELEQWGARVLLAEPVEMLSDFFWD